MLPITPIITSEVSLPIFIYLSIILISSILDILVRIIILSKIESILHFLATSPIVFGINN